MAKVSTKQTGKDVSTSKGSQAPASMPRRSLSPFEEMDQMFHQLMDRGWLSPFRWERPFLERLSAMEPRVPKVDVSLKRPDDVRSRSSSAIPLAARAGGART